jgi:NCS2 family nucleobase:cation symporter-2
MMKKPANLIYGVHDRPPFVEALIIGLQHVSIFFISLCLPVLLIAHMGDAVDQRSAEGFISFSMISAGIVTILQSLKKKGIGSGYLVPSVCGPSYLSASMTAATMGGFPLLFGMTGFVGFIEVILSRFMNRLRFLFPSEVTGVIVLMVGVVVIPLTMDSFVGIGAGDNTVTTAEVITGISTLAVMIALNVYSKGKLRLYSVLIGIIFGYLLAALLGLFTEAQFAKLEETQILSFPHIKDFGWKIDPVLIIPFTIATLSSTLKTVGDISTAQKINDVNWKRPDMNSVSGGIFADGLGGILPGLIGGFGQSTSSANVGLSIATGATSRSLAWFMGALLILLAFMPKVSEFFLLMPLPVIGATLIYSVSFMIIAGLQIIMSRMLDARKVFVVGISIIFGLSVYVLDDVYGNLHEWIHPIFSSSLSLATVTAIVLNLILRIGISKKLKLKFEKDADFSQIIFETMERQGSRWGARREVIFKASAAMDELMEVITSDKIIKHGDVLMTLQFDELNFVVEVNYKGEPLSFPAKRPDPDKLIESENAYLMLACYLAANHADKVSTHSKGDNQDLKLIFNH